MWLWLAIICNFILLVVVWKEHGQLVKLHNLLCSIHDEALARLSARIDDHDVSRADFTTQLEDFERHLGYKKLERSLDDGIVWKKEDREKALGSLFPRVEVLSMDINDLKSTMELVFEINNLKNLDSLTNDERLKAFRAERNWP